MTVHGAKGLEAPIVILADTTTPPAGPAAAAAACSCRRDARRRTRQLVWARTQGRRRCAGRAPRAQRRRAGARDEYRRLLYVAMTRAADRLIVCGADGERQRPDGCWYDLVRERARAESRPRSDRRRRQACCAIQSAGGAVQRRSPHGRRSSQRPSAFRIGCARRRAATGARRAPLSPSSAFDEDMRPARALRRARRAAQGARARPHRASADAVAARYSAGARAQAARGAISHGAAADFHRRTRGEIARAGAGHARGPALCRCLPPAAAPRCRSSAASSHGGRRSPSPARSTGWW